MKKIFYSVACLIVVGSASSCTKQCVQCHATDKNGVVVNTSNVICDHNLNRKNFEKGYENNFQNYTVVCANIND